MAAKLAPIPARKSAGKSRAEPAEQRQPDHHLHREGDGEELQLGVDAAQTEPARCRP